MKYIQRMKVWWCKNTWTYSFGISEGVLDLGKVSGFLSALSEVTGKDTLAGRLGSWSCWSERRLVRRGSFGEPPIPAKLNFSLLWGVTKGLSFNETTFPIDSMLAW